MRALVIRLFQRVLVAALLAVMLVVGLKLAEGGYKLLVAAFGLESSAYLFLLTVIFGLLGILASGLAAYALIVFLFVLLCPQSELLQRVAGQNLSVVERALYGLFVPVRKHAESAAQKLSRRAPKP